MTDREWLDSLKPGDSVLVRYGNWTTHYEPATVEAVGKRFISISRNVNKFRLRDGFMCGNNRYALVRPTPELLVRIRLEQEKRDVARWYREALTGSLSHEALKAGMDAAMAYHEQENAGEEEAQDG